MAAEAQFPPHDHLIERTEDVRIHTARYDGNPLRRHAVETANHFLFALTGADHAVYLVRHQPLAVDAMVRLSFVQVMAVLHLAQRMEHDYVRDLPRGLQCLADPS